MLKNILRKIGDRLEIVIILARSWGIKGHKENGFVFKSELDTSDSFMVTFKSVDTRIDVVVPANGYTMPNMSMLK